jgi:limonene-1,2-epoxide hydrolase
MRTSREEGMNHRRIVIAALLAATVSLLIAACGGGSSASSDPVEVTKRYYAALSAQDVDKALSYFADDAVAANANGDYYRGKSEIRTLLEGDVIEVHLSFELKNFRAKDGRVVYDFKVKQGGQLVEQGTNGLTIVKDGKITFNGSESTEP